MIKRKKSFFILTVTMIVMTAFTACGSTATNSGEPAAIEETPASAHEHSWTEATCTTPRTCEECGATEGEALGHDWVEATCEAPKTCSRCGETEGEPLEHQWTFATIDAPKTCEVCGLTEGEPVSVKEIDLSSYTKNWKIVAPFKDTIICEKSANYVYTIAVFDYEGNKLKEITKAPDYDEACGVSIPYIFQDDIQLGFQIACNNIYTNEGTIDLYDTKGELIKTIKSSWDSGDDGYLAMANSNNSDYFIEVVRPDNSPVFGMDVHKLELEDPSGLNLAEFGTPEYDKSKFGYCGRIMTDGMSGYLVANADESKYGYADDSFNEIAMYADASNFNYYGYALVSDDLKSFSIIDRDQHVVAKDFAKGMGSYVQRTYGPVIALMVSDKETRYFYIGGELGNTSSTEGTTESAKSYSGEKSSSKGAVDATSLNDGVHASDFHPDYDFDYKKYAKAKGLKKAVIEDEDVAFCGDGWLVATNTNKDHMSGKTGISYIGIGKYDNDDLSTKEMTYVCKISFAGKAWRIEGMEKDATVMCESASEKLDLIIDYMKAYPDPNEKPNIEGLQFIPWEYLYK
ncbi:hypothetical protein [Butyrivibrio sp. VCB2006]|uniref:hypothetical protein n=1 Tax=Butyrivibrio sp. VCB2006 TaxID=1280679 RepID=UPI000422BCBC|nr:hypothetical protein [Butyrivibrio sp. VCB2006]